MKLDRSRTILSFLTVLAFNIPALSVFETKGHGRYPIYLLRRGRAFSTELSATLPVPASRVDFVYYGYAPNSTSLPIRQTPVRMYLAHVSTVCHRVTMHSNVVYSPQTK